MVGAVKLCSFPRTTPSKTPLSTPKGFQICTQNIFDRHQPAYVCWRTVPLAEVAKIKLKPSAVPLNDVADATTAGALRTYLMDGQRATPSKPPGGCHKAGQPGKKVDSSANNQVRMVTMGLANPHSRTRWSDSRPSAHHRPRPKNHKLLSPVIPTDFPLLAALWVDVGRGSSLFSRSCLANVMPTPLANVVDSNVAGISGVCTSAGAKAVVSYRPVSIPRTAWP
jgi:hypothetical protein